MANGYKPNVGKSSITDILQLINAMSAGNRPTQMESNIFKEFTTGVNSTNNEELELSHNRMKEYYNKNMSSMSDDEIEAYSLLDEKYIAQERRNTKFDIDIARKNEYTSSITDFADEYMRLQDPNETNFTITGKKIIDGVMTDYEEMISMPNPNDYTNGTEDLEYRKEYNKKLQEYGGIDGYNQKKQEYLSSLNNEIQRTIGSFSDYMGGLISDYSDSGRLKGWHLEELQGLEDTYQFIVNSMEDNGLIDSDEKRAYESALLQKSSDPIKEFVLKDRELKTNNKNTLFTEMNTLKSDVMRYSNDLENISILEALDIKDLKDSDLNKAWIRIPKNTTFNPGTEDASFTVSQVLDALNNDKNADTNLISYINSVGVLNDKTKEQLKIKDKSMLANDGNSYLASQDEEVIKSLFDERDFIPGYMPPVEFYEIKEPKPDIPPVTETKTEEELEVLEQENIESQSKEVKTEGNLIEIDYSDKSKVQSVSSGVWITKNDGKKLFVKNEQLEQYQNPTIVDENSFIQSLMSKENRPAYKTGFKIGSDVETFLSIYNPKLKSKIKPLVYHMWALLDRGETEEANTIGQRILKLIEKTEINYPVI